MIFEDTLCEIKDAVMGTGYFNNFFEYAEMTNLKTDKGTLSYPRAYVGNGQYENLYDFDSNTGYVRKTGPVNIKELPDITNSCTTTNLVLTYPLRLVAAVKKELLEDNAYSDDKLIYELIEVLQGKLTISNTMKVKAEVDRYETDRNKVWSEEVHGLEEIIRIELSYIYIDFDLIINVKKDCLIADCY